MPFKARLVNSEVRNSFRCATDIDFEAVASRLGLGQLSTQATLAETIKTCAM